MKSILLTLAALFVSSPLLAQSTLAPTGVDLPAAARPSAITGMASSARHCVSGDGANVHGIGWMDTGTRYAITFESDVTLVAAVSRIDLNARDSRQSVGNPDIRATASTPGTMALFVGGNGQAGCYRYKVEITPPAGLTAPASAPRAAADVAKTSKVSMPTSISGFASSAKHCVAGNYVANVHDVGHVEEGNQVTITFASDFDPIAAATLKNLTTSRSAWWVDNGTGGNNEPQLNLNVNFSGTLALYVAGYNGSVGCYRYKVNIR